MGFDTYQTRASRDGGVDCVAHYKKSVIGGSTSFRQSAIPIECLLKPCATSRVRSTMSERPRGDW